MTDSSGANSPVIDSSSWRDETDTNGRAADHQELDLGPVTFPSGDPAGLGGGLVHDLTTGASLGTGDGASGDAESGTVDAATGDTESGTVDAASGETATGEIEGDPDQTRPGLVAAGIGMTAVGAGLLAGAGARGRAEPVATTRAATADTTPLSVVAGRPGKAVVAAELPPKVGLGARVRGP